MPDAVVLFTGIVVFAQMFDVGLRYRPGNGVMLFRDAGLLLRSLVSALAIVPLGVFVALVLLPVPAEVAIGLVILAAAPGAPLTTRRAEAAAADRDYVATLQLVVAALAMVHMPLVLAAFDGLLDLSAPSITPAKVARQVAVVTFLPLTLGWLFARAAPEFLRRRADLISRAAKLLYVAFLAAIILALAIVPDLRANLLIGWTGAAVVIALAAIALSSGHLLGGPRLDRRAGLAIVTVARNLGLALYIAEGYESTHAAIPTILSYAVLAITLAMPYSRWMQRRSSPAATSRGAGAD